jgi:hypothetical protein
MGRRAAAIYLAHLNPFTNAHQKIISLLGKDYRVYIFPVRFVKGNQEVNTRSFPFPYAVRKAMIESVYGKSNKDIMILPTYAFESPFVKYFPPIFSPYSWRLRTQIINAVEEKDFVSYTGNRAERMMLDMYCLRPLKANRLELSASEVRTMLYDDAISKKKKQIEQERTVRSWHNKIPKKTISIIEENWTIVQSFANSQDNTIKLCGMKFPKDGFL